MTTPPFTPDQADDPLMAELLEELTTLARLQDPVGLEAFFSDHPAHESALRAQLPLIQALGELGEAAAGRPLAVEVAGQLGDFQILHEAGRGGMGMVYEALQISLGRRVALKVLPFAAAMDARHLQRFKNEALAAAQLHHPHIVPVFGVGQERGVHYYAMQFIEGRSLGALISNMRQSAAAGEADPNAQPSATTLQSARGSDYVRSVARMGLQAAEALEHAHQLGIVHRDIKPGNLMLDAEGKVWVTDFGLAQFRGSPGVTATGDMLGTLRYMSPEQVLARRDLVDHRSDIYSLGVTLYEALTLEAAFAGEDREELLQRIALGDAKKPRGINPTIPIDLETVVLKAMACDATRRYGTAQELADDLRRFLNDCPIVARRPGVRERAGKWARRHPAVVTATAAVAAIGCVCLLVSFLVVWHAKDREEAAAAQARQEKNRAEANFVKALDGMNRLLVRLDDPRWGDSPQSRELRAELVNEGLRFFEQFVQTNSADPEARFQAARACRRMAGVCCATQDVDHAQAWMRQGEILLEGLTESQPDEPAYHRELAELQNLRAFLSISLKQPAEAQGAFVSAAEQYRLALAHDGGSAIRNAYAWLLADCPCTEIRDPHQAVALARQAIAIEPGEYRYWNTLGVACYRSADFATCVDALEKSVKLGGGYPHDWFFLGMAHQQRGELSQARDWLARAMDWMHQHPQAPEELTRYEAEASALFGSSPMAGSTKK